MELANAVRAVYARHSREEQEEFTTPADSVSEDDIGRWIGASVPSTQLRLQEGYVGRGKLDAEAYDRLFRPTGNCPRNHQWQSWSGSCL